MTVARRCRSPLSVRVIIAEQSALEEAMDVHQSQQGGTIALINNLSEIKL